MVYKYAFCNQNRFHPEDMTLFNHFFAQEILKEVYGNSRKDMENRWKCFIARIIHFFGIFHKTAIDAVSFFLLKQESYPDEKVFLRNFRLNFQPLHWLVHTASKCFFSFFLAILFAIRMLLLTQGLLSICYWVFTEYYSAYSFAKSTQWRRENDNVGPDRNV